MHPSKFFKETSLRTGIDTFEIFDKDLRQKLMQIHPLNFIKTKVTLPVYKVIVKVIVNNCVGITLKYY